MPEHNRDHPAANGRLARLGDRLEGMVAFEMDRLLRPAKVLAAEVDGVVVERFVPDTRPTWIRGADPEAIVTLCDEYGTTRAELSVEEGGFGPIPVDRRRLFLALSIGADHWRLAVTSARPVPERLAAATIPVDDPSAICFGLTTLGHPEVDADGWFSMEGFCDPRLAGRPVVVEVDGIGRFDVRVERRGALRVLARVPGRVPPGEVDARRVRARWT